MEARVADSAPGATTERHIAWLTLLIGFAAGGIVAALRDRWWGAGLAIGAVLAWLNFRWLRQGLDALVTASTAQAGAKQPQVPVGAYFRALFRYALIALTVYVIFIVLRVPLVSMVVGLCALGAATIAVSVYEILRPAE
jgi:ATP synthase I chain